MLRAFQHFPSQFVLQQIGFFQCFKSKVIKQIITVVIDFTFNFSGMGAWELGLRYERYDVSDASIGGSGTTHGSRIQGSHNCSGTSSSAGAIRSTTSGAQSDCSSGAYTMTVGLKWILNPNVMVKAAYSKTRFDDSFYFYDIGASSSSNVIGGLIKTEDILSVRTQFTF
jgi:opacity protein-like surface antigen